MCCGTGVFRTEGAMERRVVDLDAAKPGVISGQILEVHEVLDEVGEGTARAG